MAKKKLGDIQVHIPEVALEDYVFLVSGKPKAGKTSLFAKLVKMYYGDLSKGLLLAFEKGYQALQVRAVDIDTWTDFDDITDQLVANRNNLGIKFLCFDTADIMWEMSQQQVIKEWNIQNANNGKRAKDISQVGAKGNSDAGYGVGYNRAKEKIRINIDKLMKAGYGIMIITHSKDRSVEEKSGLTYDQLNVSLPSSARDIFVNLADFIIFLTNEKKRDTNGVITNDRFIYWRTDGYVEAGSRFASLPEKTVYDVKVFLDTFQEAVKLEIESMGKNIDEVRAEKAIQREEKIQEDMKSIDSLENLIERIKDMAFELRDNYNISVDVLSDIITGDPDEIKDVEKAREMLEALKNLIA